MFKSVKALKSNDEIVYFHIDSYNKGTIDTVEGNIIHLVNGLDVVMLNESMEVYVISNRELRLQGSSITIGDVVLIEDEWFHVSKIDVSLDDYDINVLIDSNEKQVQISKNEFYYVRID